MEHTKNFSDRYRLICKKIPCIILLLDKEENIIEVNERIKDFDYKVEDIIGKNLLNLPLLNQKQIENLFNKKGKSIRLEILSGNNQIKYVIGELVELEEEIAKYLIILHDISEEEHLKTKLKEEEDLVHEWFNIGEKSIAGIYIYDEDFNIIYVNPSFCEIIDYSRDEIIGKKTYEFIYEEDINLHKELARKRFSGEIDIAKFNLRLKKRNGEIRYCYAVGRVGKFKGKKVILGTLIDITERVELENKLKEEHHLLERTLTGTIYAISKIVEVKDPYTAGHQLNVAKLSETIAKELGFEENKIKEILYASLLHDIGKISVPSEILVLPRKLTTIEYTIVKTHPITGYNIIKVIPNFEKIAEIVLQHHERLDGSGYPKGIKGDEILIETRIISVSDVVEAMINHRPYRPALSLDDVIEELLKNKEIKYDKEVVDICIYLLTKKNFKFT
ncbi:MAG: PAS domain S-box protein [bacterium]|nr:PAS domain S-box protein [bacterium]MDW8164232.1 PAS domain S-box protein [Candidatus Omnitrophota bacterium]